MKQTVTGFLESLASDSPTPGGGSVSALACALSLALEAMVGAICKARGEGVEEAGAEAKGLLEQASSLVKKDEEAYNKVVMSFRLPKETEKEKEARKGAIQEALLFASLVPLETARLSVRALEIARRIAQAQLKEPVSDLAVASWLARAGLHGALLNVEVNLTSLRDEKKREELSREGAQILERGERLFREVNETCTRQVIALRK